MKTLVVGGGVSANMRLRELLEKYCLPRGIRLCFPERSLSTDNGAMIAAAAIRREKEHALLNIENVKPWMPLAL